MGRCAVVARRETRRVLPHLEPVGSCLVFDADIGQVGIGDAELGLLFPE